MYRPKCCMSFQRKDAVMAALLSVQLKMYLTTKVKRASSLSSWLGKAEHDGESEWKNLGAKLMTGCRG